MFKAALSVVIKPFTYYNYALDCNPLTTKCLTSGTMYAGGDVIAQFGENLHNNKARVEDGKEELPLVVDWKRAGIFFVFGTFLAGPAYHYWFNYLDELPAAAYRLKQLSQRGKILRSYAYLRSYNIEVKLNLDKLPKASKLGKWSGKAIKIAADQLIFSTIYTLVFFMSIGCMGGGMDRVEQSLLESDFQRYEHSICEKYNIPEERSKHLLKELSNRLIEGMDIGERQTIIDTLTENEKKKQEIKMGEKSFSQIFNESWSHTKSVYVQTYIADCLVWPPLQLINFTFVPLRFQVLYVNIANLGWNTFLSVMANKKH